MKGSLAIPAIDLEIAVQREDLGGSYFFRQTDQTGIRKSNLTVPIPPQYAADCGGRPWERERNLKNAFLHIFNDGFRCSSHAAKKMTTFGNYRLTCHQRVLYVLDFGFTFFVILFAPIEQCYDDSGIEQNRGHLPKSFKWDLFDPRSLMPESNCPIPIMRIPPARE